MRTNTSIFAVLIASSLLAPATGCGAPQSKDSTLSRGAQLTVWEGHLAALFDDSIDPSAVGFGSTSATTGGEGALLERTEEAEFIVHVKVETVATEGPANAPRYLLTLRVIGDPIAGPRPSEDRLNIVIEPQNRSYGIAKARDLQLSGTAFIAFLRHFQDGQGSKLHWHLARDGEDVLATVKKGLVISELSKE